MKNIVILGASSGIGRELAMIYAAKGNRVAIAGRRVELLESMQQDNPDFVVKSFDISQIKRLVPKLEELVVELGSIDMLIISAGIGDLNPDLDFEIEQRTINTNVMGFTSVCDWAMNYFIKEGGGHLVGISSVAALRGSRHAPSYYASKAYQMNYLEGMRQKVCSLKLPLYVTDIRPGLVDTDMAKGEGLFWITPVEKAASQIYRAIERKKGVAYITKRWRLVAMLLRLLPKCFYNRM